MVLMDELTKRKDENTSRWKNMEAEDKILLIMECICYFLTVCTLVVCAFAFNKGFDSGVLVLIFSAMAFIACGLSARSSRKQ